MNDAPDIVAKVQKALEEKAIMMLVDEGDPSPQGRVSPAVEQKWTQYIEGIKARRVGKLMGMIVQPETGVVRLKDPLGNNGNYGFVEMDEQTLEKVATLGLP